MDDQKPKPKAEKKGRYRKVEVRMWGDEKFKELSPMLPCGQGLWIYLLTGPHTCSIPGVFKSGRAAMAEELGWELEAFDKAFQEVIDQGLVKADWKAKVIWIPNAIKYNKPENPNVVKSWSSQWEFIPECDLKREAYAALKAIVSSAGKAFAEAFDKSLPEASLKTMPKTIGNQRTENREQNKEHMSNPAELDAPQSKSVQLKKPKPTGPDRSSSFDEFWQVYPKKEAKQRALQAFKKIDFKKYPFETIMAALEKHKLSDRWIDRKYIPQPATWLNGQRWLDELDERDMQPQQTGSHVTGQHPQPHHEGEYNKPRQLPNPDKPNAAPPPPELLARIGLGVPK